MALCKCKMCGGDLEVTDGISVAECIYCGTQQTLPKANDEVVQNLFNRANNLRLRCEFDKAEQIYEKILQEDDTESEAHWGIVLCKYGIEYVEDPKTYKRIPTCHRTSYDAVTTDADYLSAIKHADAAQRGLYEAEAKVIDEIQKNILNIVKDEKPFDVFICYKETDGSGKRTVDSAYANDIYYQLTQEGLKVFYAAITLEDKLGQEYEPYIFAALNSAKVMLVIGTKPQYFTAVWVKNEWRRFLKLMKSDRSKLLIPCYKDMDAYELPEEFAHLQAQDMSKIGFINDVVRGIKKVTATDAPKPTVIQKTVVTNTGNANTAPLLERAFLFLEDGEWDRADNFCEQVLNIEPKNAWAYLGKLMAQLRVRTQDSLKDQKEPFSENNNYQKAIRFADDDLKDTLTGYIEHIVTRNENTRLEGVYTRAVSLMHNAQTEAAFREAAQLFQSISHYKDAKRQIAACNKNIEELKAHAEAKCKDRIYTNACALMASKGKRQKQLRAAITEFKKIPGWKDADKQLVICQQKLDEMKAQEEADRLAPRKKASQVPRRSKKIVMIAVPVICAIVTFGIILSTVIVPNSKYRDALALMNAGKYDTAISAFEALNGYKDSAAKIDECKAAIIDGKYTDAIALMEAGKYDTAISAFESLGSYKDSAPKIDECKAAIIDGKYADALALLDAGKYDAAISAFEALGSYKDSHAKITECQYRTALSLKESGNYKEAAIAFGKLGNYADAKAQSFALWAEFAQRDTLSAGGSHTVGLKADGTVVAVGNNDQGQCDVSGWRDIIAISAGYNHTVGLKADGTVVAVGSNQAGQCDVSNWKDIVAISAGAYYTVGIKADGTVIGVGNNYYGQRNMGWTDIIAISAGSNRTVGLKADGNVVAVGDNTYNQCEVYGLRNIIAIGAGDDCTLFLYSNGTMGLIGHLHGIMDKEDRSNNIAISAGSQHILGLKADGTVMAWGVNEYGQCEVSGWTDIIAISAKDTHTVGLKADGTVVAVGNNEHGQCDVSGWTNIMR